jgi:hypothetical protein
MTLQGRKAKKRQGEEQKGGEKKKGLALPKRGHSKETGVYIVLGRRTWLIYLMNERRAFATRRPSSASSLGRLA